MVLQTWRRGVQLATTYDMSSNWGQTKDGLLSRRGDNEYMTPMDTPIKVKNLGETLSMDSIIAWACHRWSCRLLCYLGQAAVWLPQANHITTGNVLNHDSSDKPSLGFAHIVLGYAWRVLRIRRRQKLQAYPLSDSPNCLGARGLDPPSWLCEFGRLLQQESI